MSAPHALKAVAKRIVTAAALYTCFVLSPAPAQAQSWVPVATVSSTTNLVTNSLCVTDGTDLRCDGYGGIITTSGTLSIGSVGVGNLAAGNISATGNVSVTNTVSALKFVGDGSGLTNLSSGVTISTGASGSLVYRDGAGSLIASSGLSISSTTGSVGIGAAAPASAGNNSLYAAGNVWAGQSLYSGGLLQFSSNLWQIYGPTGHQRIIGDDTNKYLAFNTSSTEALRIVSTGYVGIGTTTPSAPLHVSAFGGAGGMPSAGSYNGRTAAVFENSNSGGTAISIQSKPGGSAYSALFFGTAGGNEAAGQLAYLHANQAFRFITQGGSPSTTTMIVNPSGTYIGPNTATTPSTTLTVNGAVRVGSDSWAAMQTCDANRLGAIKYESGAFQVCRNTTTGWETLVASSGGTVQSDRITSGTTSVITYENTSASIATNGVERITVGTNGNVGMGTTSPAVPLHVVGQIRSSGAGNGLYVGGDGTGGTIKIVGSGGTLNTFLGTSSAYIGAGITGFLGIGTNSPSTRLDVSGTLKISSAAESCDSLRLGAIKYESGAFQICRNTTTGWETLVAAAGGTVQSDRITSGTTSVITYENTSASIATNGVERVVVGANGNVGIGQQPNTTDALAVNGSIRTAATGLTVDNYLTMYGFSSGAFIRLANNNHTFRIMGSSGDPVGLYYNPSSKTGGLGDTNHKFAINSNFGTNFSVSGTSTLSSWTIINSASSSPTAPLEVAGLISSTQLDVTGMASVRGLRVSDTTSTPVSIDINSSNTSRIRFGHATGYQLSIGREGNNGALDYVNKLWIRNGSPSGASNPTVMQFDQLQNVGIGIPSSTTPTAKLDVAGTLKIAAGAESCDTLRLGAIKYESGAFQVCRNTTTGWETLAASASGTAQTDRITSGTTSIITYNNTSASIATNGVERVVVGTNGNVGIARQPISGIALAVSGSSSFVGRIGLLTPTSNSVFVGSSAGSAASGVDNVGLGFSTLQNTTGSQGVGVGVYAGQNNTGEFFTGIGYGAGLSNAGTNVTAIGGSAGQNNAASYVVAVGVNAGQSNNTGGTYSTFVGNDSGQFNNGTRVAAIGAGAAQRNSAANLTALGSYAGQYNSGADSVAIGYNTGQFNTGARLTAVGQLAAAKNTADDVTALGFNAVSAVSNTFTNITGLGYDAQPTKSNQVMLGNTLTEEVATSGAGVFGRQVRPGSASTALMTSATLAGAGSIMYDTTLNALRYSDGAQWNTLVGATGSSAVNTDRITSGTTGVYTNNNTSVTIATAGVDRVVVGTTGGVGIGQQPGTASLAVSGTSNLFGNLGLTGMIGIVQKSSPTQYGDFAIGAAPTYAWLQSFGGTPIALNPVGNNVGIGTSNPGSLLHLQAASSTSAILRIYGDNNLQHGLSFGSSQTDRWSLVRSATNDLLFYRDSTADGGVAGMPMILTDTGNLGIGVQTPSSTLHLNGSIRIASEVSATLQVCDANRLGAIKYESGQFQICRTAGTWETLVAGANGTVNTDRITSGTLAVIANSSTATVSLSTAGTTWGYVGSAATYLPNVSTTMAQVSNMLIMKGQVVSNATGAGTISAITSGTTAVTTNSATNTISFTTAGSQRMVIAQTGNVGIGNNGSTYKLDVTGNTSINTSAAGLTYLDVANSDPTGSSGSVVRIISRNVANTGNVPVDLVKYASGAFMINNNETNAAAYTSFGVSGGERMRISSNGAISIGTVNGSYPLAVNVPGNGLPPLLLRNGTSAAGKYWQSGPDGNNAYIIYNQNGTGAFISDGGTAWSANSDQRLKKDITPLADSKGLAAIMQLKPVTYHWRTVSATTKLQTGLIAQEVEKVLPELVEHAPDQTIRTDDGKLQKITDTKGLNYTGLVMPLIQSVQELKHENDTLKAENADLRKRMDAIEKKLESK